MCNSKNQINDFIKSVVNSALHDKKSFSYTKIGIKKDGDEIVMVAAVEGDEKLEKMDKIIDVPPFNGAMIDFVIDLASAVSVAVHTMGQSKGGKKSWANLTPEQRSARAKKAAAARFAGKPRQTIEERRAYQREWMRKKRAEKRKGEGK